MKCLRMLTFIPVEELEEMEKWDVGRINEKKEVLAYDLTNLVHGQEEAQKAKEASRALFSGIGDDSSMPTTVLKEEEVPADGIALTELMLLCRLAASKTEARRLIQQGGVSIDGEKVDAFDARIAKNRFEEGIRIRKGKKVYHKVVLTTIQD